MSLAKLSIADVDLSGKRVFVRTDYNVPQDKEGNITNLARIEASLPTLRHCLEKGCKSLVLASHLGRPKGTGPEAAFTLAPVAKALESLLGKPVTLLKDCCGPEVESACANPAPGSIFLLENLRFHKEETNENEDNSEVKAFRASLAKLADIYCNDAFGTAHRPHSSMVGEGYSIRCAGFLMQKEIDYFRIALSEPKKPYLAILGGAKVADKIKLIKNLLPKVDKIIICGGMSFTFLKKLKGMNIANSLYDKEGAETVDTLMDIAKAHNVEVILPVDCIAASEFDDNAKTKVVTCEEGIPEGWMGLDCGPASNELFAKAIMSSKTVIWNGPPGVFEMNSFCRGTMAMVDAVVKATEAGAITIIGGGDSATAAKKAKATNKISHVSTGGGASLELLQGDPLPGVIRLSDKK
ncbi:Phosphoglycerate kinase [Giardia duodenalis]|uniref:Phosphoglycerate kinase n=1 Tax=Giardia intestinalis (strain ATCC 50803 / WB clone C6) TaxID=184922 RepID=A8BGV6_GIAIC|nr:Phosphoglycerate kinase [Giardia intestinalis]KAE8301970.1 Phosphoglycerate kinase [Giardia intestinalis]|eukprot:XP_001706998.1 Phosphoglycerate kinase [Giardia lamblia ATCC 50803]